MKALVITSLVLILGMQSALARTKHSSASKAKSERRLRRIKRAHKRNSSDGSLLLRSSNWDKY